MASNKRPPLRPIARPVALCLPLAGLRMDWCLPRFIPLFASDELVCQPKKGGMGGLRPAPQSGSGQGKYLVCNQQISLILANLSSTISNMFDNDKLHRRLNEQSQEIRFPSRPRRKAGQLHQALGSLKPKYGHWVVFDHCMPFDVTRCYEEVTQHPDPRIWTAERDRQMWETLES